MGRLEKIMSSRAVVMHSVFALIEGCRDELAIRAAAKLLSWLSAQTTMVNGGPNFLRGVYKSNLVAMMNCGCGV